MKYVDAEKLKAEIERKYAEYKAKQKTDDFTYYEGMADALDIFEQFIDSLQQEQQEVDLEKEIKRYTKSCEGAKNANGHIFELDWNSITAIIDEAARHFYELGKNSK